MLVDYERVVLAIKREVASKKSHGGAALLAAIAQFEVDCIVEEGLPERALRLYGVALSDDLITPTHRDPDLGHGDGDNDRLSLVGSAIRSEEHHVGHHHP